MNKPTNNIVSPDFGGFDEPKSNYCKFPLQIIDELPNITTISEMKVMLYILRHTWGYQEFDEGKKITLDEFEKGRKRRDGTRLDNGTGLSIPSIRSGIAKALEHGYISIETDNSDLARVKNYYALSMKNVAKQLEIVGERNLHPEVKDFTPRVKESLPRTEKETKERNLEKDITPISPLSADESKQSDSLVTEMQGLVKTELKQYTKRTQAKIAKGLLGLLDKSDEDYNISKPLTIEQFKSFIEWWDKNHIDKEGKILTRPKNLGSVKSNVERWLDACNKPKPVTIDRRMQARKLPVNIEMLNQGQSA